MLIGHTGWFKGEIKEKQTLAMSGFETIAVTTEAIA